MAIKAPDGANKSLQDLEDGMRPCLFNLTANVAFKIKSTFWRDPRPYRFWAAWNCLYQFQKSCIRLETRVLDYQNSIFPENLKDCSYYELKFLDVVFLTVKIPDFKILKSVGCLASMFCVKANIQEHCIALIPLPILTVFTSHLSIFNSDRQWKARIRPMGLIMIGPFFLKISLRN